MSARGDSPTVYCGTITHGDLREIIHATTDGIYARLQRRVRTVTSTSAWSSIERVSWVDAAAEATLVATEDELVAVLLRQRKNPPVATAMLDAWAVVADLRRRARDVVLGPSDWTPIDLTSAGPS